MRVRVGNAPISWGVCEIPEWGPQLPSERVLDEMRAAGYEGTELGPWGFLPTDPGALAAVLQRRGLVMAAAFVPLRLRVERDFADSQAQVRSTAQLLRGLGARHILFADAGDDLRYRVAGRPEQTRANGLRADEWEGYVDRLHRLARLCRVEFALQPCFHSHGGSYIENPEEIATLLERTDPALLRLCLDTGHVAFGGGDPLEVATRFASRLGYIHLKDINLPRLRSLLSGGTNYVAAAQQDVFVELGRGSLDLPKLFAVLRAGGYEGWIIVEQDRVVHTQTDTLSSAKRSREYLRTHLGV